MKIYLVIKNSGSAPEIEGVFSSEEKAKDASFEATDITAELSLDVELPRPTGNYIRYINFHSQSEIKIGAKEWSKIP